MWSLIETRCADLKLGRSQYFQMLVENDLRSRPDIHAHKSDGKWHFYPEAEGPRAGREHLRAADELPRPRRPRGRPGP